jgi:hypothetical protein
VKGKRVVPAGILLLALIFCCAVSTADTYNFAGTTDTGTYIGTLVIGDDGAVAVAMVAATGDTYLAATTQNGGDTGGASAMQSSAAAGDSVFVGTGAVNGNGDSASVGALAIGSASIEAVQYASSGGIGSVAGQAASIAGQRAVAGSLGISGAGDEASTDTHLSNGGNITTIQGALAAEGDLMGVNTAGAAAGQLSTIKALNGGWASSTAADRGSTATTGASVTGMGNISTLQGAVSGNIAGMLGTHPLDAGGALAAQLTSLDSDGGGAAWSSAANGNGCEANTEAGYSGSGYIDETIQGAGAGGVSVFDNELLGGALALQYTKEIKGSPALIIDIYEGAWATSSATNNNGYSAATEAYAEGNGLIQGTIQGATASDLSLFHPGIPAALTAEGACAAQYTDRITSDIGGAARSLAVNNESGSTAFTTARFMDGGGEILSTIQGAAAGEIGVTGVAGVSVDGAVAGQYTQEIRNVSSSTTNGWAFTRAAHNNGEDRAWVLTGFLNGGSVDEVVQLGAGGDIMVTTPISIGAEGAVAAQYISSTASNPLISRAVHGTESDFDFQSSSPAFQWAVAGTVTDGFSIEGAEAGSIP